MAHFVSRPEPDSVAQQDVEELNAWANAILNSHYDEQVVNGVSQHQASATCIRPNNPGPTS